MKLLSRTAAGWTVVAGLVVVAHFSATPQAPAPTPFGAQALLPPDRLPSDWPRKVAAELAAAHRPARGTDLAEVVRYVEHASARFGVDPLLALAVIQVESRFDPTAVSPRGAIGLMQVLPETAAELAPRIGISIEAEDALFDPETNILLGTYYLSRLLERFESVDAALAAFHAGPTRIESRVERRQEFSLRYADRVWDVLFALQAALHSPVERA